jgi:hypothetical protein
LIICCDWDGTCTYSAWPEVGRWRFGAKTSLRMLGKMRGITLILNTCREGDRLEEVNWFLVRERVWFDYTNNNCRKLIKEYGDCRKVTGDFVLDDKAFFPGWIIAMIIILTAYGIERIKYHVSSEV